MPETSISASETEKSQSFTPKAMPSGRDSRFFNSSASFFIMLGGRSSYAALTYHKIKNSKTREVTIHKKNPLSCLMNILDANNYLL